VLFDLSAPFTDAQKHVDVNRVRMKNNQLVMLPAPPDAPGDLVPLLATSEGNVELQAVFPDAALKAARLGVAINVNRESGESYEFILAAPKQPAAKMPQPGTSTQTALYSGSPAELQIV